jgi:hypothetical protein
MTDQERSRLIAFLEKKMCRPCLKDGAEPKHEGCVEAEALIAVVARES